MNMLKTKSFKKGEVIFREGDRENWMYGINKGEVGVYVHFGRADEKQVDTVQPGDDGYFGEMALIEGRPRSATAVALQDCELVVLTAQNLNEYFQESPMVIVHIVTKMSQRLRKLDNDYMEVCRTIAENEAAEQAGQQKPNILMDSLKKFANIWNNAIKA